MITYQKELATDCADEISALMSQHWEECKIFEANVLINRMFYGELEERGMHVLTTARKDGKLIGYTTAIIMEHPNFGKVVADFQGFFVLKDYRKGMTAVKLLKESEKNVIDAGAEVIFQRESWATDMSKLYSRLGYRPAEICWSKGVK